MPTAPADFRAAVARYDARAAVGRWDGPRYRLTYRTLGDGPTLLLVPGIASTYRGYAPTLERLAGRFRTVVYDYPGENPGDGAVLSRISHDDLVDDVFGLLDHLNAARAFPFGLSFGSTVALRSLARDPGRFPRAAVQGGFARRAFTPAERFALWFGRRTPGTAARLPFRRAALAAKNRAHFRGAGDDRWDVYVEQNGMTPIGPLSRRLDLVSRLDLRPVLAAIPVETLVIQGDDDRVVPRRHFDELVARLPRSRGLLMPGVGHQPHYTHPEALADAVGGWFLPPDGGASPATTFRPTGVA